MSRVIAVDLPEEEEEPHIDRVQICGIFLWTVIFEYIGESNQVENSFLESVLNMCLIM